MSGRPEFLMKKLLEYKTNVKAFMEIPKSEQAPFVLFSTINGSRNYAGDPFSRTGYGSMSAIITVFGRSIDEASRLAYDLSDKIENSMYIIDDIQYVEVYNIKREPTESGEYSYSFLVDIVYDSNFEEDE